MRKNRIPAAIAVGLILTGLAGCVPRDTVPGNRRPTPAPAGNTHTLRIIIDVATEAGGKLHLPVSIFEDVTIVDGEHGISRRTSKPYPDRWQQSTPVVSTITYRDGSNPTTFTMVANLQAVSIVHLPDHLQLIMRCYMYHDDHLIHLLDERSHVWEAINITQAKNGAIKSIGVTCKWVDQ